MTERKNEFRIAILIGIAFLWTGSGYLTWTYRLAAYTAPIYVDLFTEVVGYLFQALGLIIYAILTKNNLSRHLNPSGFAIITVFDLFSLSLAVCLPGIINAMIFGYIMNLFHGAIAGYYLHRLASDLPQQHRGLVFGIGYSIGCIGSWVISAASNSNFLKSRYSLILYIVLAVLTIITAYRIPEGSNLALLKQTSFPISFFTLAAVMVCLLSLTKSVGFYFPSADFTNGAISVEFSRIFYAFGLVLAGLLNDKTRKYGAQSCIAALFFPFVMFFLREDISFSSILWILNYFFFGFFAVYRVLLFSDLADKNRKYLFLSCFGLLMGRIGDAFGALFGILLADHELILLILSGIFFATTIYMFFSIYQKLYFPVVSTVKNKEMLLKEFSAQYHLTPREKDVLALITDGRSNSEISGDLFISENTVKFHIKNILKKTGCSNRTEILALFRK